jgi:hypothetical protein
MADLLADLLGAAEVVKSTTWEIVEETPHSLHGASGYYKWGNCPGSLRMEARVPKATSEYAEEGTKAHKLAEKMARAAIADNWKNGPQRAVEMARFYNAHQGALFKNAAAMMDAANAYVSYLREIIQRHSGAAIHIVIEHGFDLSWLRPDMFGTCDAVVIVEWVDGQSGEIFCELHVIDFKYGQGVMVAAQENWQLGYYALGALKDFELIYNFTSVNLHVVQPRIDNFDNWPTTPDWLRGEFAERLAANYDRTLVAEAPLNPGPWCAKNFCNARSFCPALAKSGLDIFNKLNASETPKLLREVHSDDALAMQVIQIVRTWADAREAEIKKKLLARQPTTATSLFKVVPGKSTRVWSDLAKLHKKFPLAKFPHLWTEAEFKSPRQVEIAVKDDVLGTHDFELDFSKYVEKIPGAPTVAPITDKRTMLDKTSQAQSEFQLEDQRNQTDDANPLDELLG